MCVCVCAGVRGWGWGREGGREGGDTIHTIHSMCVYVSC